MTIICSICGEHVNYVLLRAEYPKCGKGHELGRWVSCGNRIEQHVYLSIKENSCPYCGSQGRVGIIDGTRVKCLHLTPEGVLCVTRPFFWIREGPPCFMNHLSKMKLQA